MPDFPFVTYLHAPKNNFQRVNTVTLDCLFTERYFYWHQHKQQKATFSDYRRFIEMIASVNMDWINSGVVVNISMD